ncbi:MAG TPA: hypothetical protein DCR14_04160 [Acidimicrobiaceae bacterium]|nr:hypothetical protein [Acidimicrobiaceae bacterium]
MLEELLRILSLSGRDRVDACTGAARLWALHRIATQFVLQAYPETRSSTRLVMYGDQIIQPVSDDGPRSATPDTYSDPVFDERGLLADFTFRGTPVSQQVAAFRGNGDTSPVHAATVHSRGSTRCGMMVFPSGIRWGDPWRLARDRRLWERVVVNVRSNPDEVGTEIGPHFGRAYVGPDGVLAAQLAFTARSTQLIFSAELLRVSLGKQHIELQRVWDLDAIPTSDLLD